MVQALVRNLRHMHQTIALAEEVHESPKVHQLHHFTGVDLAFFRLCHDRPDHVIGLLDVLSRRRGDLDDAFVVDVHLGTRQLDDLTDHFAARADHFADLVRGDLQGFDLRRIFREALRRGERLVHLTQDMQTAVLGLRQSLLHDLGRDARNLDVHLQRGDARRGASHLEIHVAEVILVAKNVGQHGPFAVIFQDQTHRDARNRRLQRHACIHHRQRTTADRRHRGGAVRFGDLRHHANGVGEIGRCRQNRLQGTPCQLAMANLTTTGRANAAHFTHRIGREVIVQQEVRPGVAIQRVDDLLIFTGAKGGDNQTLGFATGEQGRTMGARQDAGFAHDRADGLGVAAVNPGARVHHIPAQDRAFQLLDRRTQIDVFQIFVRHRSLDRIYRCRDGIGAVLLVADRERSAHLGFARRLDLGIDRRQVGRGEIEGLIGSIFGQIQDQVDDGLHLLMAEHDRAQHFLFGQLIGFRFHHHHGVFGASDNQIQPLFRLQTQLRHVIHRGVQHIFAIDETNASRANRAHEGHARNGQRRRGGDHGHNIGVIVQIARQHGGHDQNFVLEAFNEQRADRTVDQTRGQRFLLRRARLTLEKAAGDLAGCIVFFLIMHGQRKEILPRLWCAGIGHVGHDAGFAKRGDDRAVSLTGNLAGFQGQRLTAPLD